MKSFINSKLSEASLWTLTKENSKFLEAFLRTLSKEQYKYPKSSYLRMPANLWTPIREEVNDKNAFLWIPTVQNAIENGVLEEIADKPISEEGYMSRQDVVDLLRKYKNNPEAIHYIADMME